MIGIIDYGMGNLTSVKNALDYIGADSAFVSHGNKLSSFSKLILPGVGAFGQAMVNIRDREIDKYLTIEVIENKKPLLGLCLGMQLLFETSNEHGLNKGLGYLKGTVDSLKNKVGPEPVPHMGWNSLVLKKESRLLKGIDPAEMIFYFVHSYYCIPRENIAVADVSYGADFTVVVESENIMGCQFHPEKSQKSGLQILKNFSSL